jgi:hypothetical protein
MTVIAGDPTIREMVLSRLSPVEQQALLGRLKLIPGFRPAMGPVGSMTPKSQGVRFAAAPDQMAELAQGRMRSPAPSLAPSQRSNYPGAPPEAPRHTPSLNSMRSPNMNMGQRSPNMSMGQRSPNMGHHDSRPPDEFQVIMAHQQIPGAMQHRAGQIHEPLARDLPEQVAVSQVSFLVRLHEVPRALPGGDESRRSCEGAPCQRSRQYADRCGRCSRRSSRVGVIEGLPCNRRVCTYSIGSCIGIREDELPELTSGVVSFLRRGQSHAFQCLFFLLPQIQHPTPSDTFLRKSAPS